MRNSRSSILICSYIGTFVIAFVIGCAVVDDERIVVVMAYRCHAVFAAWHLNPLIILWVPAEFNPTAYREEDHSSFHVPAGVLWSFSAGIIRLIRTQYALFS